MPGGRPRATAPRRPCRACAGRRRSASKRAVAQQLQRDRARFRASPPRSRRLRASRASARPGRARRRPRAPRQCGRILGRRLGRRRHGRRLAALSGRISRKRRAAERATRCSSDRSPPCSRASERDTASPSPVPMPSRLVVKKGSKMRSRVRGVDARAVVRHPQPDAGRAVGAGVPRRRSRRARGAAVAVPASACCALTSRFSTTWPIWSPSASTGGSAVGQRQLELDAVPLRRPYCSMSTAPRTRSLTLTRCVARPASARHVEEGADDARRSARPPRGCARRRRAAPAASSHLLLEQAGAPHHDRQRVVQLVRDAGQQAAHRGELLALAQRLALALDLAAAWRRSVRSASEGGVEAAPPASVRHSTISIGNSLPSARSACISSRLPRIRGLRRPPAAARMPASCAAR